MRWRLLALGVGFGLAIAGLTWAATPPPAWDDAHLAAAARSRLGMVLPSEVKPAPAPTPAAVPTPAPAQAVQRRAPAEVLLVVQEGQTATAVAQLLAEAEMVGDAPAFVRRLVQAHAEGRIQAGGYHLWRGMSEEDLAAALVRGP